MDLNYLLNTKGIDTAKSRVLAMRHTPQEPSLRLWLPRLAAEEPEIYNCYQQTQGAKVENQLAQADYLASFIGKKPGQAVFVGLYRHKGHQQISRDRFLKKPAAARLCGLGMKGWAGRESGLWFDLELMDACAELKGKLVIDWPGREISWSRWVVPGPFAIKAIHEESALAKPLPPWKDVVLTWTELKNLPPSWVHALSQWRGIYFILDSSDGKGYVGSAYGDENLYGRWLGYKKTGHGGNKLLREREPEAFRFSILERVSPDATPEEVTRCESNWKRRLSTRQFGLNDN